MFYQNPTPQIFVYHRILNSIPLLLIDAFDYPQDSELEQDQNQRNTEPKNGEINQSHSVQIYFAVNDDSNVEKFCDLIEEIASNVKTRFLVITHHPLTMARMDRLYGITMQEKGVSQLVSVDLNVAEKIRNIA